MPRPRILVDVTPLRRSRQFRLLFTGQLVSFVGSQLTVVAVPYQVYVITRSSVAVGLVSLAQLVPLLVGSLIGGAIVDSTDRRRILLSMAVLMSLTSVALAINAHAPHPALWPLFVFPAMAAGLSGLDRPARSAAIPGLVDRASLPAAYALWQIQLQTGVVLGPALAGILLGGIGAAGVYWLDALSFLAAFVAAARMQPLLPEGGGTRPGFGSIVEGLRYLRGRRVLTACFAIDLDAMVFGLPRALFPALGIGRFGGGASTVGLLFAAPGAGALAAAVLTGWVGAVRRQGRAVLVAVAVWGLSVTVFGLVHWLWLALGLLAVAGAADVVSAVFRNTILQMSVPDSLRGRLSATHIAVVTGGPRLGDAEAGAVAGIAGPQASVVSGGLACVVGVVLVAWLLPELDAFVAEPEKITAGDQ